MTSYLDFIQSLFYPADTVLSSAAPVEYEAILRLADIARQIALSGRSPGFLEVWRDTLGGAPIVASGADEIELQHQDENRSPILTIRRGRQVVMIFSLSFAEILERDRIVLMDESGDDGIDDLCRVVILTNRHGAVARHLDERASGTWRVTDWFQIASVLSNLARIHAEPSYDAWARFFRGDFRPSRPLDFSGPGMQTTIGRILHDTEPALYALPQGISGLIEGNERDLPATRLTRCNSDRQSPGRFVLPGTILRPVVEGRLSGRWPDLPWENLAGSWPRRVAERIAAGSARGVHILRDAGSTAPWDPVQLAIRSV